LKEITQRSTTNCEDDRRAYYHRNGQEFDAQRQPPEHMMDRFAQCQMTSPEESCLTLGHATYAGMLGGQGLCGHDPVCYFNTLPQATNTGRRLGFARARAERQVVFAQIYELHDCALNPSRWRERPSMPPWCSGHDHDGSLSASSARKTAGFSRRSRSMVRAHVFDKVGSHRSSPSSI